MRVIEYLLKDNPAVNVVPSSGVEVNETLPRRYFSLNIFRGGC
jgi:hypothetical protein